MLFNCLTNFQLVGAGKWLELLAILEEGESWHGLDLLLGGEIVKLVNVDLNVVWAKIHAIDKNCRITFKYLQRNFNLKTSWPVRKRNIPWGRLLCRPFPCSSTPALERSFYMDRTRWRKSRRRPRCSTFCFSKSALKNQNSTYTSNGSVELFLTLDNGNHVSKFSSKIIFSRITGFIMAFVWANKDMISPRWSLFKGTLLEEGIMTSLWLIKTTGC